jgi:hypothetical protein
MGREVWGTYSVRDHLEPQAWVADALLYDRLVIPVPPPEGSPEHEVEWSRWESNGWNPSKQRELVQILGDRAWCVPWDASMRKMWAEVWKKEQVATSLMYRSTWISTGSVLASLGRPPGVHAVNAVATYRSRTELDQALRLRSPSPYEKRQMGQGMVARSAVAEGSLVSIMGREFLVPDPSEHRSAANQLRAAIEISADDEVRKRRAAYWRWQREFLRDSEWYSDATIGDAVEEMADLIADEQRAIRRSRLRLVTLFGFCVATAATGLLTGPLAPATLGGAFLSIGQFVASEALFTAKASDEPSPAALFYDTRRQLGWD